MAVEKRGKNSWRVGEQVKRPDGTWEWIRLPTLKFPSDMPEDVQRLEAEKAYVQLLLDLKAGQLQDTGAQAKTISPAAPAKANEMPTPHTIRSLSDQWMEMHVYPNCSEVTAKNYRHLLDCRILPALGHLQIDQATPVVLTRFINDLRKSKRISKRLSDEALSRSRTPSDEAKLSKGKDKKLSPKTVRNYYDCLFEMLEKCTQWEIIETNPMKKVDRPKIPKQKVQYLDDDQAVDLLRRLSKEENMAFRCSVMLALMCGLRLGEVGALRFSDVDFKNGTIDIQRAKKYTPDSGNFEGPPKSEAGERLIALPPAMLALLDETKRYYDDIAARMGDRWHGDGLIVCNWDGEPYHHDTPSKQFRKFADDNGFQKVRFHDLRHTHATLLLASNIDAVAVASRLGHSDASTTLRTYAHALRRRDVESASAMQVFFDRAMEENNPSSDSAE